MGRIFSGTSGFAYPAWKPGFYPADVPQKRFLEHYATRLNAVEINYSFRRMPAPDTLRNWADATPPGFLFAMKANQRITHFQKLKDAGDSTAYFLGTLDPLRSTGRLGPVLFQLPPQLKADPALLRDFLTLLPTGVRSAFEFRDESWLAEPIYTILADRNVSLCVAESDRLTVPEVVTADFVYFRLRKPEYTADEIAAAAARAGELAAGGKDVFVFFKHEETPDGAIYAERLRALTGGPIIRASA